MYNEINNFHLQKALTLIRLGKRVGEDQKDLPFSFPLVTTTNVGISLQKFLNFSFNPIFSMGKISIPFLVPSLNY